ncbi:PLP-dependent aminotransferase family protein [Paenibacillus sp. GCM10023252]|uniref:aminotransferase-like domain-containing protein n=1 Tax=Paenibacillus sp. GCM10023252 TaxID=3252649 RepID=UPI00361FAAEE
MAMTYSFSHSAQLLQASEIREIFARIAGQPSVISLAGGQPAEEFFPAEAIAEAAARLTSRDKRYLQYGVTDGYAPLKEKIADRMAQRGMTVRGASDLLVTTGSQQAIDLLARVYLDRGDTVLVERPTFLSALQSFTLREADVVSVDTDEHGMVPGDLLRKISEHKPKLVYVIPTFSNPTGYAWTIERRQALLDACRSSGTLILEDDPYGELYYEEAAGGLPSLFAMDKGAGHVIYTGSFSKTIAPAFRTGWCAGNADLIGMMARCKQAADIHTSTIDQQLLNELLELSSFDFEQHLQLLRSQYSQRLNNMDALLKHQPWDGVRWAKPQGGMFLWLSLPPEVDAGELFHTALAHGVAFVPGAPFYADQPERHTLRLNFTHAGQEVAGEGIARLSAALQGYQF